MDQRRRASRWLKCLPPAVIAISAGVAVLAMRDPAGAYPRRPTGPGLTVDERFNVQEGVRLAVGLEAWLNGRVELDAVFNDDNPPRLRETIGNHNPDHPPLGRLWIGLFHEAACALDPPHEMDSPFVVACARAAPAAAFALTVLLVGCAAACWYGTAAGAVAAVSLVCMPRVFGHAHLASLETMINLTWTAAVLSIAGWWTRPSIERGARSAERGASVDSGPSAARLPPSAARVPRFATPSLPAAAGCGVLFGLALLTKIQAVLLPAAVALWALWRWRLRAVLPLVVWGLTGLAVFCCLWPWLWLDPLAHLGEYFGRTTGRLSLNVWYFGRQYADRDVPWHYPFVMCLVTLPAGLHLLGAIGAAGRVQGRGLSGREGLLVSATMLPLLLFAVPGVAVYDGARLFLVVFPLWAVLVGRGAAVLLERIGTLRRSRQRLAEAGLAVFVLAQGFGLAAYAPCWLSYYNGLVGGLPGASAIGLEPTYWGDAVTRDLLTKVAERVPAGSTVDVTPVLEQGQLPFLLEQSPILRRRNVGLRAFEDRFLETGRTRFLLVFRRLADINPRFHDRPPGSTTLAEVRRQGVWLAGLYRFDAD